MKGCVGCLAVLGALFLLAALLDIGSCTKEKMGELSDWRDKRLAEKAQQAEQEKAKKEAEERIAEKKRRQEQAQAEAKQREESKADKIRTFAIKDAPKIWEVYQALQSEIDVQGGKIEELRKTLVSFGQNPDQDEDFKRICEQRDDMIRSKKVLRKKLEDAYIIWRKYEASPSRKDYQALHRKALEDGIQEAEATSAKFKEMRLNK